MKTLTRTMTAPPLFSAQTISGSETVELAPVSEELFHQLQMFGDLRFSGRVDVQTSGRPAARFYFCLGRLVWFAGGHDPVQRWRRLLTQFCPDIQDVPVDQLATACRGTQGYEILSELMRQGRIRREQIVSLIETALAELVFDLLQEQVNQPQPDSEEDQDAYDLYADTEDTISAPMTMLRIESVVDRAHADWHLWQASGLAAYSPNLAPTIRQGEQLRRQTSPQTYEILTSLIDGHRSLRSLALKMDQNLITLTRALLPYVTHGVVSLVESPQLAPAFHSPTTDILPDPLRVPRPVLNEDQQTARPLVACIDDSPHICKSLEGILTAAHYRFTAITDPLQAIPTLLKLNPDLIFLDLVMPVANGYEICSQIRRISLFKDTPVIILTGNDSIVDRMRTKWVGSTEFLPKPVEAASVLALVDRYLAQSQEPQ